jgi:N-acetylglucosaminyl-diphospho-decaprenol L-rhamnosyltransferase
VRSVAFVSVVHGRAGHLRRQQRWLERCAPTCTRVVVAMSDPSVAGALHGLTKQEPIVVDVDGDPRRLPVARARNVGAARALETRPDVLVFLDVDCLPTFDLTVLYARHTQDGVLASGPVTYLPQGVLPPDDAPARWFQEHRQPHPARPDPPYGAVVPGADPDLFWSLSFAVTPKTWSELGGFWEQYEGYGAEDTDFGWNARRHGVELAWVGGADAFHQWHPVSDPPVEHVADILFHSRWGTWPMEGWLQDLAQLGLVRLEGGTWRSVSAPREVTG